MSNRPTLAMKVTDLPTTIKFCIEKLGFTMVDHLPYADIAHVLDPDNDLLLIAGPQAKDIPQIVHHLAESETLFILQIKTALAASGAVYIRNPYDQEMWPETLDYAGRAIEPSVALVKAVHAHVVQLVQHIPDYWERYVIVKAIDAPDEEGKNTVGRWLETMARHLWEHCEEIREIRRIHGV